MAVVVIKNGKPVTRRVVCAALRRRKDGFILCGPRHFDGVMRGMAVLAGGIVAWADAEEGFVDQWGRFLTREEALRVARAAKQIIRRRGGDADRLYSENLY